MSKLGVNLRNRRWLIDRLRAEIIGPDPPITDKTRKIEKGIEPLFESWNDWRVPKVQATGEEILWQDPPIKRYGAGVLFPIGTTEDRQLAEEADSTPGDGDFSDPITDVRIDEDLESAAAKRPTSSADTGDSGDDEVTLSNAYRPSALGLSLLADLESESEEILIEVSCARYRKQLAFISGSDGSDPIERTLWLREPVLDNEGSNPVVVVRSADLLSQRRIASWVGVPGDIKLQVVVVSRPHGDDALSRLLTVCLVNREQKDAGRLDDFCFFQCSINVKGGSHSKWVLPYPEAKITTKDPLDEDEITRLLYRDRQTFAVGHGCAATWPAGRSLEGTGSRIGEVWSDCLPEFETAATSADITGTDGSNLRVSMRKLGGLDRNDDGFGEIGKLVEEYRGWIASIEDLDHPAETVPGVSRPPIPIDLQDTANGLIRRCKYCLDRIEKGIAYLTSDSTEAKQAMAAFQLMNEAMLIAQLRSSREVRTPSWDQQNGRFSWDSGIHEPDPNVPDQYRGYWRPFQIAFILMCLPSMCDPDQEDRVAVDLIWFPTGGGKTEAYLGLTAFTILFNRICGTEAGGVDVLMRYTLRLLTAQQFQRAGLLFCALENVRNSHLELLGEGEFRIGMWVGGSATPNKRSDAVRALKRLQKDPQNAENPFVLLKCPWCNARFGPAPQSAAGGRKKKARRSQSLSKSVFGYASKYVEGRKSETVVFRCDDPACDYSSRALPIVVVDEDIYENPPNLVIATVDKFAMLAWKPEVRRLLGVSDSGERAGPPPSLIIQDELHLISGPLGSMVGAYETVIHELCCTSTQGRRILPKIIASTATICRAEEQVRSLYAREDVRLFPPSGLEDGDSFFSREARDDEGNLLPGRLFAGVMAPAHGSQQTTQARMFASLLQYPAVMPVISNEADERDPWWTVLSFFNSLRELGGAATLLVSDTRDYLRVIIDRHGFGYKTIRQLFNVHELTSRIRSDQIPLAIQKLEIPFRRNSKGYVRDTVEACLASSIIEVGVDIDRLSLMTIVGQPKTTSQYIQVSSRVGRRQDAPGLVVVSYSQSKPRDRSHYERFRTYHERLYAQVEPTSVTPFSPPAVDRALHGVVVSAVRQVSPPTTALNPRPCPIAPGTSLRQDIETMIEERVRVVDPSEASAVMKMLKKRFKEWQAWDPKEYGWFGAPPPDPPLLHPAGTTEPVEWNGHSWPTLTSMRDVDATCEAEITGYYNELEAGEDEQ
ncbi:helicase C-terminal domain-containing protein [bacterium]|nr:helicase C-terminal domain-containing protein [bacterium]